MSSRQWGLVALIYSLGVLVTSTFGLMAPLAGDLRTAIHGSTEGIGTAYGILFLPFVLASTFLGAMSGRIGMRNMLLLGATMMFVANMLDLKVNSLVWLLSDNFLDGFGMVTILITGQVALANEITGKAQAAVMSLWATASPVGVTLGLGLASSLADSANWRLTFAAQGVLAICLAAAAMFFVRQRVAGAASVAHGGGSLRGLIREYKAIRLSTAFAIVSLASTGPLSVWPLYLSKLHSVPIGTIARMAALGSPAGILGSIAVGYLLSRAVAPGKIVLMYVVLAILTGPVLYFPGSDLRFVVVAMALTNVCVGASLAFTFAMLPRLILNKENIGAATGFYAQLSAIACTASPPLFFAISTFPQAGIVYVVGLTCLWIVVALVAPVWGLAGTAQPQPIQEHV